ncbi:phosphatase PAP2 family protein [Cellulomonas sp. Sa3CUA2]|uniref:Phosphatase PAP2 family protein n=1 Tax=Cellulomonas avistercoris TaxID=2762242 RepID=A0ABR8QH66_9CELL|nr:phosphatase PAP2 family protein [Cellulomonas avistercoris]MBD7919659.1 phosphatase PAP2 family protein [Cellulomonas avistercoris]
MATRRDEGRVPGLLRPHDVLTLLARADRAAHARTSAYRLGARVDAALVRLSTAADRSRLWCAVAAGLALTGWRGQRAALRGLGSVVAASALANLLGKLVFGGRRPDASHLPWVRRLARQPTSGSFPSGHSASAAAFATGVALEWPAAGVAVAPVAAAVAYSRLHVGAHWVSDVAGGVALGAGVALAGRRLVPSRRLPGPDAPAGPPVRLPALPDGEGLTVVVNPRSGAARVRVHPVADLVRGALPRAHVVVLDEGTSVAQVVREAAARGARAVGAAGGDGTAAAVADAARREGLPLLVLPTGTLNHFALTLGLPSVGAAARAAAAGTGAVVDVGELTVGDGDPVTVLNTFSVGVYPQLVTVRDRLTPRIGKPSATLVAAARALRASSPVPLVVDDEDGTWWSLFAGVGRYHPRTLAPVARRRLDDGVLDVRDAGAAAAYSRLRAVLELVAGDLGARALAAVPPVRRRLVVRQRTAATLTVGTGAPAVLAHDGETTPLPPASVARLRIVPGALRVYAAHQPHDDRHDGPTDR